VKYYCFFTFLFVLCASYLKSQVILNPPIKVNKAFIAGEKLTYKMQYGLISAGYVELSLYKEEYQGKVVFHSVSMARTSGLAEKIYGVKDIYESWFYPENNMPYRHEFSVKEGRFKRHNKVTYDRSNNTVDSELSGIDTVPELILDLSSILYYVRRIDFSALKVGEVILLNMYFPDEVFPFYFVYNGKEDIKTKAGKISCIRLNPLVEVGRMFRSKDDLSMWLSDDGNLIPILIRLDIRIAGSIDLYLTAYEKTANPLLFNN
jgi:hypothetical protein